jgi:hypothetical protein
MADQPVDSQPKSSDNTHSDDANDVLYISMGDKKPLNDPNCQHINVIEDKTEELGRAFLCADCKIGWIMSR